MFKSILITTLLLSPAVLCDGFFGSLKPKLSIPSTNGLGGFLPNLGQTKNTTDSKNDGFGLGSIFGQSDDSKDNGFNLGSVFKPNENKQNSKKNDPDIKQDVPEEDVPSVTTPSKDDEDSKQGGFNFGPFKVGPKNDDKKDGINLGPVTVHVNNKDESGKKEDDKESGFNYGPVEVDLSGKGTPWDAVKIDFKTQEKMNAVVDKAVAELIKNVLNTNKGKIEIPDVHTNFSTGKSFWKTTGEFDAYNGTFANLTTLSRTDNVKLDKDGLKFVGSAGFGLSEAKVEYQYYKARYGIIKVDGEVSATVSGVTIFAVVEADYVTLKCSLKLKELKVKDVGKVKAHFTGFGLLNKPLSYGASVMADSLKDKIVGKVEDELRAFAEDKLKTFDCEQYRPFQFVHEVGSKLGQALGLNN